MQTESNSWTVRQLSSSPASLICKEEDTEVLGCTVQRCTGHTGIHAEKEKTYEVKGNKGKTLLRRKMLGLGFHYLKPQLRTVHLMVRGATHPGAVSREKKENFYNCCQKTLYELGIQPDWKQIFSFHNIKALGENMPKQRIPEWKPCSFSVYAFGKWPIMWIMPMPYILQNMPGKVSFGQNPALSHSSQVPHCVIPSCTHNPVQSQLIAIIFSPNLLRGTCVGCSMVLLSSQSDLHSKANTYLCAQQHSQSALGGATWTKLPKISLEVLLAQGPEDGLPSPLGYRELLHAIIKLTEEIPPWDKLHHSCIQKCV